MKNNKRLINIEGARAMNEFYNILGSKNEDLQKLIKCTLIKREYFFM